MKDQFPTARGRVHAFSQALKTNLAPRKRIDRFDQMLERTTEAVQFPDHQCVSIPCVFDGLRQTLTGIDGTAGDIVKDLFAAGLLKSVFLQVRILVGGGNPCIADARILPVS